jgi:hypothetical protein
MVFDNGQLKEFAAPQELLDMQTSLFSTMAKDVVGLRSRLPDTANNTDSS